MNDFMDRHITGERIKNIAPIQVNTKQDLNNSLLLPDIIYVKTDYIAGAMDILRKRDKPCSIITHNSDYPIGEQLYLKKPETIKFWYAQNVDYSDSNLVPVPLGCENPITPTGYSGNMQVLNNLIEKGIVKDNLVLFNMNINTNVKKRKPAHDYFCGKKWVNYINYGISFDECMLQTARSKYVICPQGNGIDSHRVWETLYLGGIPIVKKCIHFDSFRKLPILIVDDWEEVTETLLVDWYEINRAWEWDYSALDINYWKRRVQSGA